MRVAFLWPGIGELDDDGIGNATGEVISQDEPGISSHNSYVRELGMVDFLGGGGEPGSMNLDAKNAMPG